MQVRMEWICRVRSLSVTTCLTFACLTKLGRELPWMAAPADLASVAHHVIGSCDGSSIANFLQTKVLAKMDSAKIKEH